MKRSLNLMSNRSRKREQIRRSLRFWSRVSAGVFVLLTIWGYAKWRTCHQEELRQASVESEYEPIRQLKLENRRLRKQIKDVQTAERLPLALAKQQPLLGLIGLATQAIAEHDGKVYLKQIEIERDPLDQRTDRQTTLTFALNGIAVDSGAVTRLADSLRATGPFAAVDLDANKTSRVGKQTQQAFLIQCTN